MEKKILAIIISIIVLILLIITVVVIILVRRRRRGQVSPPPDDGPDTPPQPQGPNGQVPADCSPANVYRHSADNGSYHADTLSSVALGGYQVDGILYRTCQTQSSGMVAIYRLYNSRSGDYMTSTDPKEAQGIGYQVFEPLGYVWPTSASGLIPIYRVYRIDKNGYYHMSTTNPQENTAIYPNVDNNGQPIFYALPPLSGS